MATQSAQKQTAASTGFRPLKDRVLVSYSEESEKTAGGIYIPEAAKEKPQKGKINAIGSEVKNLKVGNLVLFDKYSGSKVEMGGTDYLIVKEEDILGVFEN